MADIEEAAKCHVLDFKYDHRDGCDLTVLLNGVRFLIMVETERLNDAMDPSTVCVQYQELVQAVRDADVKASEEQTTKVDTQHDTSRSRTQKREDPQDLVHGSSSVLVPSDQDDDDNDSGFEIEESTNRHKDEENVSRSKRHSESSKEHNLPDSQCQVGCDTYKQDPRSALQNWILSSFGPTFDLLAPTVDGKEPQTLQEWYHGKTYFFTIEYQAEKIKPIELEEEEHLRSRMSYLTPNWTPPKHIQQMRIPLVSANDIKVLRESDLPAPRHPAQVEVRGERQFLKVVDNDQHPTVRRELKILWKIEELGLYKKMNVPRVLGLAYFGDCKKNIMGFLLTDIKSPTPLTELLDGNVEQRKRKNWAQESRRMINVLHEHSIIWGDAKADNFLVDENDDLWIIDFGGSYTEGWIEPELAETEEGDEMGIEKIVNALQDPIQNTFDPVTEQNDAGKSQTRGAETRRKRKRQRRQDVETCLERKRRRR